MRSQGSLHLRRMPLAACAFAIFALAIAVTVPPPAIAQSSPDISTDLSNPRHVPTVDELFNIRTAGTARISPDGKKVAYTITSADFEQDAYNTQIWIVEAASGRNYQLTRGAKSASAPVWSPDGGRLAFVSTRADGKSQVFLIDPAGGEAVQLTKSETGIQFFDWAPDGRTIAYLADDPEPEGFKSRKETYGDFEVVRREHGHTHIWTVDVPESPDAPIAGRRRTSGNDFTVEGFAWSPDGKKMAFSASPDPDTVTNSTTSDIFVLDLAGDKVRKIVDQIGPDSDPSWSPDGGSILFLSAMGSKDHYLSIPKLAVVPADGGAIRPLAAAFDEESNVITWNGDGIYFQAYQKTASHIFRHDPASLAITRISGPDEAMIGMPTISRDGKTFAFSASSPKALDEIFVSGPDWNPRPLTRLTAQVADLILGSREVISWKSRDGAVIEGVLIKPADFDPARKYPLLCIIHGGPTGIDRPALLGGDRRIYPSDIWAARGALILKVNYRGSMGYGEKFRRLNYRNLGVGDAWDVLSGVDNLVAKGWADPARVGCMGWSQGGYISAFLTTSSRAFKAVSVGAGISDWATYYYNTDITPFTIGYLGADPVADPDIYAKTSPITYIKKAATPTLIQHGELDRRVPIPNAYELRQALDNRGVPVEMVVYKGFGHGISKPRAARAATLHNLLWFNHYIFGDPKPDLAALPLPEKPADAREKP